MKIVYKIIASGFGTGFSPIAPGTAGSLIACLLLAAINYFFPQTDNLTFTFYILQLSFIALFTILGIISVNSLQADWGHDSPKFTIDEITGMWISVFLIPFTLQNIFIAFVLFRFFDILKPFGIRSLEKIHGGWGVMLDDILAGIFANIILHIYLFYF